MSDSIVSFVSTDPFWTIAESTGTDAIQLLLSLLPGCDDVKLESHDHPRFVDAGENFERVHCPVCSTLIPMTDWEMLMQKAWTSKFMSLDCRAPCCGATVSLNELEYLWPQAFASTVLWVRNPRRPIPPGTTARLRKILGTQLRVIYGRI